MHRHEAGSGLVDAAHRSDCAIQVGSYRQYIEHAIDAHQFAGTIETETHQSESHYSEWFASVTKKNQFSWVQAPGNKATNKRTHFMCSRSGMYKQEGDEKRNRSKKSTRKLDAHCTCFLTVDKVSASKIVVEYCLDHLGHGVDLCHLPKDRVMKVCFRFSLFSQNN